MIIVFVLIMLGFLEVFAAEGAPNTRGVSQPFFFASQKFFSTVSKHSLYRVVILDFWAPWCMPCSELGTTIDKIFEKYKDKILLIKVNVDQYKDFSKYAGVKTVPDVRIYSAGKNSYHIKKMISEEDFEHYIVESFYPLKRN